MAPLSRNIEDYPEGIIIPIDKPYRWTSADVIRKIKYTAIRHFGKKNLKVGHAGTLDPLATGVLLVCIGKATKLAEELQSHDKEYVAGITFGATTPSYDLEKEIDRFFPHEHITASSVAEALPAFIGEQDQIAPLFSAKSVDGVRAYELARKLHREGKTLDEIYCELIDKDSYYNSAWSKIIRREVLVENKIEFISGLLGEDNEWYYNVVMAAKHVVLVDEPLYVYRRRQSSITSSLTEKNLSDQLFVIAKWDGIIKREVDNPHIKVVRGSLAKQYCSALIIAGSIPDAKPYYAELRKYRHLLNYTKTRRVVIFRWIVWLLGVNGTIAALSAYKKIR